MEKSQLQEASMVLIAYAGDAYGHFSSAIDCARAGDFDKAEEEMELGKASIAEAHKSQLELLASEGRGEDMDFSLLLVHAQDHLMMAMSFEHIAREFIQLYRERE